jgi:hypothetical protein
MQQNLKNCMGIYVTHFLFFWLFTFLHNVNCVIPEKHKLSCILLSSTASIILNNSTTVFCILLFYMALLIDIFAALSVTFFPSCICCQSIANEHSVQQLMSLSQMRWDHLRFMCNERQVTNLFPFQLPMFQRQ